MAKKVLESAQTQLMQRIKETLPGNISFVDELADLLEISNDSAYRRMRGETALSIEELTLLCKHFRISFDSFINNNDDNYVSFSHHQLNSHVNTFTEYLQNMNRDLDQVLKFPEQDRQVFFAAEDVPVFQHFAHPYLTAFKIFYWNKSILSAKGFEDKKFEAGNISKEMMDLAYSIYDKYARINSVEIWSDDTVNSTFKQIEFYWDAGAFKNKEDALRVCEEVKAMMERISLQAEMNRKLDHNNKPTGSENNYALYHSDVMIGNNCVFSVLGGQKGTYISYNTFNFMLTTNPAFCNETDLWMKNLIKKSNLISGVAEKSRYRYFKMVDEMLNKLVNKIKND
jgi:hypothetical protein